MSDPGHVGPKMDPGWWDLFRQIVMFLLALFLVIWSVATPGHDIPFLVTAMVLFGLIPVERAVMRRINGNGNGGSSGPEGRRPPPDGPLDEPD